MVYDTERRTGPCALSDGLKRRRGPSRPFRFPGRPAEDLPRVPQLGDVEEEVKEDQGGEGEPRDGMDIIPRCPREPEEDRLGGVPASPVALRDEPENDTGKEVRDEDDEHDDIDDQVGTQAGQGNHPYTTFPDFR